ncbi:DUF1573 domain-containing protein [Albibacterium sp.]|uniref:DUF1573 domain-containing protein n=1 Tax=Albibacterium sp. TaxID=2952885 RepID=UPI002C200E9D|nr:DUF1573 domain-containing protein [Albibacterium sp.]HUH19728.1 DUF1573 domain-containing protein [Albibacterium sp.]
MKNLILVLSASFFLASCGSGSQDSEQGNIDSTGSVATESSVEASVDTTNAPIVYQETDTYSFGEVKEGEKVSHEYAFTNTGKTPLIINSVRASCGCTTPYYPKHPIKPGEEFTIDVVFDTSNQPGLQHKVITMESNAYPSQTIFHLKGEVK